MNAIFRAAMINEHNVWPFCAHSAVYSRDYVRRRAIPTNGLGALDGKKDVSLTVVFIVAFDLGYICPELALIIRVILFAR